MRDFWGLLNCSLNSSNVARFVCCLLGGNYRYASPPSQAIHAFLPLRKISIWNHIFKALASFLAVKEVLCSGSEGFAFCFSDTGFFFSLNGVSLIIHHWKFFRCSLRCESDYWDYQVDTSHIYSKAYFLGKKIISTIIGTWRSFVAPLRLTNSFKHISSDIESDKVGCSLGKLTFQCIS